MQTKKHTDSASRDLSTVRVLLIGTFLLVSLVLSINTNDSTLLKPMFLHIGVLAAGMFMAWSVFAGRITSIVVVKGHMLFAVFLLASALSLFKAENLAPGFESLTALACYGAVFFIACQAFPGKHSIDTALGWVALLTAASCVVGLAQGVFPSAWSFLQISSLRSLVSTFGNSSYFAGYLVLVLPIVLGMMFESKPGSARQALLIMLIAGIAVMLALTGSRSGWIAAAVSLALFAFLNYPHSRKRWLVLGAMAGAAIILALLFPGFIHRRLAGMFAHNADSSFARRLFFYEAAWRAFLASPVIGHGAGNFPYFMPAFRSPDYWMFKSEDIVTHAHNEFLEILSETGALGMIAFLALIAWYGSVVLRSLARENGPKRTRMAGYLCGMAAVLIDNLGNLSLRTYPVAMGFWFIMALSLREAGAPSSSLSVRMPPKLRSLRYLPATVVLLSLLWYMPFAVDRYITDRDFFLGFELDARGYDNEAAMRFADGLAHRPHDEASRFSLASSYAKLKRYREGKEQADTLLKEYRFYPKAKLLRAVCAFEMGDTAAAWNDLRDEMRRNTGPQVYYYASYFSFRLNRPDEELSYGTTLLNNALASGIPEYVAVSLDRYAKLNLALCDTAQCDSMVRRIRQAFSSNAGVMTEVVECYGMMNRLADARSALAEAMAIGDRTEEIDKRLREISNYLKNSQF